MNVKEIFLKIKAKFDVPADVTPGDIAPADTGTNKDGSNVISYNVDNGQPVFVDISDDGIADIDANDAVYTDETMTTPYADGTYKVTGTDFGFTVAGGIVSSIDDKDGKGAGTPIEDDKAPVTVIVPPAAAATLEQRVAAIEEEMAKQKVPVIPTGMATEVELKAASQKVDKHEQTIKDLFDLVEKLCEVPTADPKTLTGNKKDQFEKSNTREKKLESIAAAIKEMKNKS